MDGIIYSVKQGQYPGLLRKVINRERPNHHDSECKPSSPDGGFNTKESAFEIFSSSSDEDKGSKVG